MIFLYLLVLRDDKFISFVFRDSTPACIHTYVELYFLTICLSDMFLVLHDNLMIYTLFVPAVA